MKNSILILILVASIIALSYLFINKKDQDNLMSEDENVQTTQAQSLPQNNDPKPNENIPQTQSDVDTGEQSNQETFQKQPGVVLSITNQENNGWVMSVNLLTHNPNWLPGVDSSGGFFIDQNPLIRNLNITSNTQTYECDGSNNSSSPQSTAVFLANMSNRITPPQYEGDFGHTAYFDIVGTNINAIYTQCLP